MFLQVIVQNYSTSADIMNQHFGISKTMGFPIFFTLIVIVSYLTQFELIKHHYFM